ncbi:MAG: asparaginase [Microbacterium sp.]
MSGETFGATGAVELAVIERGGFVESRHVGAALVLSPDGESVLSLGAADAVILPRSSLKPLQAIGSVSAGASLAGEQLAIATASHGGTDRHAAIVLDILTSAELTEDALGCPATLPADRTTRDEFIREGIGPSRIRMGCSGKHAAMLAACVANGWPTNGYLDAAHPVQVHIREVIERLTGEKVSATVVDGCGAPVHALTLAGLGRALHRIATSSERSPFALHRTAGQLVAAVRAHPWVIDGPSRPDTVATETFGVFSKYGAEGVQTMIAPDGTSVVVKVLDGSNRAGLLIALSLLARAGALPADAVAAFAAESELFQVRGGDAVVGRIRPTV